jgi:hypothetical protein
MMPNDALGTGSRGTWAVALLLAAAIPSAASDIMTKRLCMLVSGEV